MSAHDFGTFKYAERLAVAIRKYKDKVCGSLFSRCSVY